MVDFHDPTVLFLDYSAAYYAFSVSLYKLKFPTGKSLTVALLKLCHALGGLYIWEFVTTLDYEWRIVQGRQPYRWTIWIYSFIRLSTLMGVIGNLVIFNITTQTNCQAWVTIGYLFPYMAFVASSLLIILRIIAIWNRNKVVVALAIIVWVANISFIVYGVAQLHSAWVLAEGACSIPNVESNKVTVVSMFCTDVFLLVVMLVGLLRMRMHGAGTFPLGQLLWKQGVVWLLLATAAELPPAVFICLNLNSVFDTMFLMPSLIIVSTAATRMYRSLVDFLANDVAVDSEPRRIGHAASNSKLTSTVPTLPERVEVAVHTIHEEYPISLTDHNVLHIGNRHLPQLHDKQDFLCFDDDVESGM